MQTGRFYGTHHHKVDAKGRLSVPAAFRRVIEAEDPDLAHARSAGLVADQLPAPRLMALTGSRRLHKNTPDRRRLECLTVDRLREYQEAVARHPRGSRERRAGEFYFSTWVQELKVDANGRIVLPAELRADFGLEGEALFVARNDRFEIWAPEAYEKAEAEEIEALFGNGFDPFELIDPPAEATQAGPAAGRSGEDVDDGRA